MTVIGASWNDDDTYFIFRGDGSQVRFTIEKGLIKTVKKLTVREANHIREKILTKNNIE